MSAQHAPHDDGGRDPHDIIPEEFYRAWPGETVDEKLRAAEEAPSSTDPETQARCPECESIRLVPKAEKYDSEQREPGGYVCASCGAHVDDPDPPLVEEIGKQATLDRRAWR